MKVLFYLNEMRRNRPSGNNIAPTSSGRTAKSLVFTAASSSAANKKPKISNNSDNVHVQAPVVGTRVFTSNESKLEIDAVERERDSLEGKNSTVNEVTTLMQETEDVLNANKLLTRPRVPLFVPPRKHQQQSLAEMDHDPNNNKTSSMTTTTLTLVDDKNERQMSETIESNSKSSLSVEGRTHQPNKSNKSHSSSSGMAAMFDQIREKQEQDKLIKGPVEDVAHRFARFRTDVVRSVLFGVHCLVFGGGNESSSSHSIILLQKSREEFDFVRYLEHVSIIQARFIVLEETSWARSGLAETLFVLNRGLGENIPFSVCAGGSICYRAMEGIAQYRGRGGVITSCAFIFPPSTSLGFHSASGRMGGLERLPVYLELDCRDSKFEQMVKASGCQVETSVTKQTLQDFLRGYSKLFSNAKEEGDNAQYGIHLTQYLPSPCSPPHESQDQSSSSEKSCSGVVIESSKKLVLVQRVDPQTKKLFVWTPTGRNAGQDSESASVRTLEYSTFPSAKPGDVLLLTEQGEGSSFRPLLMRKDDSLRASFLALASKEGELPIAVVSPTQQQASNPNTVEKLLLCDLLSGTGLDEGRRDLRVKIVLIDKLHNELVCTDTSLAPGLFARICLQRPYLGCLHQVSDFQVDQCFELRNARIESDDRRKKGFRVVLDSFTFRRSVTSLDDPWESPATSPAIKFPRIVSVKDLSLGTYQMVGEFRLEAIVKDVLFSGFSYIEMMRKWPNIFSFTKCIVDEQTNLFKECLVVLGEAFNEEWTVSITVPPLKFNELIPFVRANSIRSKDMNERLSELVLFKKIVEALVFEHNKKMEFALLRKQSDVPLELLTMDV